MDLLLQANPSWLVVETDLSSAFQRASREEILFELFNRSFDGTFILRDFIPLFLTLYGEDSKLFFGDFCELWSEEGSQQGCPLGGMLFILSIAEIIVKVKAEYPGVTPVGFADDYRFLGPYQEALDAARMYRDLVVEAGHAFQAQKSCIFSRDQGTIDLAATHPFAREMEAPGHYHLVSASEGLKVMGGPLGATVWSKEWLETNTAKVQVHMDAVVELGAHDHENSAQAGGNVVFIGNISRFDGLENRDESVYKADDDDDNHDLQDDDDNDDASGSQNFQPSMVPPNVNAGTSISQTISKLFKLKAWNHTMQISTQMNKV